MREVHAGFCLQFVAPEIVKRTDWPLFESCKNADVSVSVALALGTRTVIAEEHFDSVSEFSRLSPVDVDNQR